MQQAFFQKQASSLYLQFAWFYMPNYNLFSVYVPDIQCLDLTHN